MADSVLRRSALLLGEEAIARLKGASVCVIGLGGVGSYAVEALARAGIGRFTLIDFDIVGETNLNRQLFALRETIGQAKVDLAQRRILAINPEAKVICHQEFLDADNRVELLAEVDSFIDAIDSLGPKIGLLEYAVRRELEFVSVMGAGNRLDPAQVQLTSIKKSHNCPLARRVRKYLGRRGIKADFPCVWSSELPLRPDEDTDIPDEIILQRGRQRQTVGSVSYLPAIMGMVAASWVIRQIACR
ncbi:MAG TPA: tRNA threonylcarbamoyladenosine dehydratase [Candidatus Syntrophosphaera sp.]|jgi:tRNA A37 threonylcarbamoyladenosine dehydratase|nr:tRNA threonylcarbamoyladenosine dehydratase [Candidatus Cloacimonadota bacterium]HOR02584.1 tRNA threonylcarbamoyladenosine dehydratase [Candidatus Syntrophosphaera sp.]HQG94116.1 tRNA threonylcarbamoyladenosine dehydratase [Candidatus Syntrophosphaera sp.]HQK28801.1 tRNA threonylcarbamoyladenosine dehydratase [Candidatus Syntrophosphaera sp.]HQO67400.1 tRNA threonylcarbamoyladenosine dehydratase [Candidatus Syntrophosphaera sp.]